MRGMYARSFFYAQTQVLGFFLLQFGTRWGNIIIQVEESGGEWYKVVDKFITLCARHDDHLFRRAALDPFLRLGGGDDVGLDFGRGHRRGVLLFEAELAVDRNGVFEGVLLQVTSCCAST